MTILEIITAQGTALLAACILDIIFGNPDFIIHPVRIMRGIAKLFEKITRFIFPKGKGGEITAGLFTVIAVIAVCGAIPFAALYFAYSFDYVIGVAAEVVICYFMLSARQLGRKGKKVYNALLSGDMEEMRYRLSKLTGRSVHEMSDDEITKAAVAEVAKNTTYSVAAIIFMAIGGGVLGCVYRAIRAMDIAAGHKDDKYRCFGKIAAKLDDFVNYIPSRIAARLMIISSYLLRYDGSNASHIHRRDRRKHDSPNAGETQSVAAGALCIELGGNTQYTIGDSLRDVRYDNILHTNRLMYFASFLTAVIFIALKFYSQQAVIFAADIIHTILA